MTTTTSRPTLAPSPPVGRAPQRPASAGPGPRPATATGIPPGRLALAEIAGAAAVLLGAVGLRDLILTTAWWPPLLSMVGIVLGLGLVGTLARARWWIVTPVQAVAVLLAAPALARVTGTDVLSAVGEGIDVVRYSAPPVDPSPSLVVMLLVSFGLVAVGVDAAIRTAPALAGAGVLAVVVTTLTIAEYSVPALAVLGPAIAYLLVLLLTAAPAARSTPEARARAGAATLGAGVVLTILAVAAGLVAPRLAPDVPVAGRLSRLEVSTGRIGASPMTELTGDLLRDAPVPILELRTAAGSEEEFEPDYLRAAVLTQYTAGVGWESGRLTLGPQPDEAFDQLVSVTSLAYAGWFLPVPDRTVALLDPSDVWSYYPELNVWHVDQARDPGEYVLGVVSAVPLEADLLADRVNPTAEEVTLEGLPEGVVELATQITADHETPFEKARALQDWFLAPEQDFLYSLSVPEGSTGDPLLDFLEMRQGYCEQFASTMAVLARAIGLPARVVVGYGPGATVDGLTTISTHDAHAWVEVRFENAGWVRFEPTPPDGRATRLEGYAEPEVDAPEPSASATTAAPSQAPSAEPSQTSTSGAQIADDIPQPGASLTPERGFAWGWLVALGVVVLLGWIGPSAERARRRRARLAVGRGREGADGAWEEVEALAVDHGVQLLEGASVRESARLLGDEVSGGKRVEEALTYLVRRAEAAWYAPVRAGAGDGAGAGGRARTESSTDDARRAAAAVGNVRAALVRVRPRRGLARWFPRSLLAARWRDRLPGVPVRGARKAARDDSGPDHSGDRGARERENRREAPPAPLP